MTAHLAPAEAYRRDLTRVPHRTRIGERDGEWLLVAHGVWRTAGRGGAASAFAPDPGALGRDDAGGERVVARLFAALAAARHGSYDALVKLVSEAALAMEQGGALFLAASGLSALRRILDPDAAPLLAGRVAAQWARVERHLGDFDVAADLYDATARLGRRHALPELVTRAEMGRAVLARIRGNYPETRRRFQRALALAEHAGLGELTGLAHQGLLIAAAVAGDFDSALTHGWAAFAQIAGEPAKEAEVLVNLGTLCLDARQDDAALRAFASAAARTTDTRTWLTATAGAAAAAARLGHGDLLAAYAAAVERAIATEGTPYERAQHLLTLCDAYADAGAPRSADDYRARGLEVARAHGFAELLHRYVGPPAPATEPLRAGGRWVVRALRALPGHDAPSAPPAAGAAAGGRCDEL